MEKQPLTAADAKAAEKFFEDSEAFSAPPPAPDLEAAPKEQADKFSSLFGTPSTDMDDLTELVQGDDEGDDEGEAPYESADYEKAKAEFDEEELEGGENMRPLSGMSDAEVYEMIYPLADVGLDYGVPLLAYGIESLVNALPTGYYMQKKPGAKFSLTAKEKRRIAVAAVPVARQVGLKVSPTNIFIFVLLTTLIGAIVPNYEFGKKSKRGRKRAAPVGPEGGEYLSTAQAIREYPWGKDKLKALRDSGALPFTGGGKQGGRIYYKREDLERLMREG